MLKLNPIKAGDLVVPDTRVRAQGTEDGMVWKLDEQHPWVGTVVKASWNKVTVRWSHLSYDNEFPPAWMRPLVEDARDLFQLAKIQ